MSKRELQKLVPEGISKFGICFRETILGCNATVLLNSQLKARLVCTCVHDYFYIFGRTSHRELPSTSARGADSSEEHHRIEIQALTRHQCVVIWVREAGEVWSHVIHLHPHVHNVPKARQTLQLAVINVVEAKAIEQEHQELAVGRGGGGKRQERGEGSGQEGGEEAAALHGRRQRRICGSSGAGPGTAVPLPLPAPALKLQRCPAPRVWVVTG